jgi:hypothetical protein
LVNKKATTILALFFLLAAATPAASWYEETHLAIAKAAGYAKWYDAAAADIAKAKMGAREGCNHYFMSPSGTVITPAMVLDQARRYDRIDPNGHLYGAIIESLRDYMEARQAGKYAANQMAYLVHYVGDLSMPLHNTPRSAYDRKFHGANDGIIEHEVLGNLDKIKIYDISIGSEMDLAKEIARIANISKSLGDKLKRDGRLMTRTEAYIQIGHSASLLRAILRYTHSDLLLHKWRRKGGGNRIP